jgi:hypothetical protein
MSSLLNMFSIISILILLVLYLPLSTPKTSGQDFDVQTEREKRHICDSICEFEVFLSKPVGNISISILGGIMFAAIFALILTFWQKPKLRFISKIIGASDSDKQFYHISVKNSGHTTAYNCKVDIEFIDKQSGESIQINFAKWVQNPESVTIHMFDMFPGKIPHDSLLKNTWYMNIHLILHRILHYY